MGRLTSIRGWGLPQWGTVAGIVGSLAAVAALFSSGGDDGAPKPDPDVARAKEVARAALHNFHAARYDELWHQLHPADQRVVPLRDYVRCETDAGRPVPLLGLELEDPVPYPNLNRVGVPNGTVRVVDATETTRETGGSERKEAVQVYVAKVGGEEWKLLLLPSLYAGYRKGRCPHTAPDLNPGTPKVD